MKLIIKKIFKKILTLFFAVYRKFVKVRLWLKGAYYTIMYVDEYKEFPCIVFTKPVKLTIDKSNGAKLIILKKLILEPMNDPNGSIWIVLFPNSTTRIINDFVIGDKLKIVVDSNAQLILKGKVNESASGITGSSSLMVHKYVEIGQDCIIAWDTFITDCDWHKIEGKIPFDKTIIGDKVWIGVGAKILKGANIGAYSIVATNSVVLKGNFPEHSLLSGSPAKIIKENIAMWHRDM